MNKLSWSRNFFMNSNLYTGRGRCPIETFASRRAIEAVSWKSSLKSFEARSKIRSCRRIKRHWKGVHAHMCLGSRNPEMQRNCIINSLLLPWFVGRHLWSCHAGQLRFTHSSQSKCPKFLDEDPTDQSPTGLYWITSDCGHRSFGYPLQLLGPYSPASVLHVSTRQLCRLWLRTRKSS